MKFRKCCGRNVNLPHASTCPARMSASPLHLRVVRGVQTLAHTVKEKS